MAGPNTPRPQTGGRSPSYPAQPHDPQARGGGSAPAPRQYQPQAAYSQQAAPQGYVQSPYVNPGEAPAGDPYAAAQPYQQGAAPDAFAALQGTAPAPAYAQQYDPYPQLPGGGQDPHAQGYPPQGQGEYAAQGGYGEAHGGQPQFQNEAAYDPRQSIEPWPSPDQGGAGYDQFQAGAPGVHGAYDAHGHLHPAPGGAEWGGHAPAYGQVGQEPGFDPAYGGHPEQAGLEQTYAEDDGDYDVAEPRSWRTIAFVLVSFVAAGGGLAYAYSALLGTGPSGAPPVVKSASGPFKVKPSERGGKQFAHSDSKIMGRLGSGGRSASTGANGVREVPVLVVGRDGTIQPPAASPEKTTATIAVPGMTVIDGLGGAPSSGGGQAAPVAAPPKKMVAASEPASPPKAAAPAKPKVAVANIPPAAASKTKTVAAKKPVKKAAVAAPRPVSSGAGYVAVLASVPASKSSRMDALKQFADIQQKYGALLQNKTPDVKEANLGAKGTYHRLLVGPPGSRDQASSLCVKLKAEGYKGCWVTAY
jgi:SPOR domain